MGVGSIEKHEWKRIQNMTDFGYASELYLLGRYDAARNAANALLSSKDPVEQADAYYTQAMILHRIDDLDHTRLDEVAMLLHKAAVAAQKVEKTHRRVSHPKRLRGVIEIVYGSVQFMRKKYDCMNPLKHDQQGNYQQ